MSAQDVIDGAIALVQKNEALGVAKALALASTTDHDAWTAAAIAILTHAGITPAALGPDMVEQLVAWSKATSRDDVIAVMQRAAA